MHHPKLDEYEGYILAIVHGIRFDAPTEEVVTRELDIFLKMTRADLQRVAQTYFTASNRMVLYVLPPAAGGRR